MNIFPWKIGATGKKLTVTFGGRPEGLSDITAIYMRYAVAGVLKTRTMTKINDLQAEYQMTSTDVADITTANDYSLDFKTTHTGGAVEYWPDEEPCVLRASLPLS